MMRRLLAATLALSCVLAASTGASARDETPRAAHAPDFCKLIKSSEVSDAIGEKVSGEALPHDDNYLGSCGYRRADGNQVASIAGIPVDQYDRMAKYLRDNGVELTPVQGLGVRADNSPSGLVVQPEGAPYCLVVVVSDMTLRGNQFLARPNPQKALALAGKLVS